MVVFIWKAPKCISKTYPINVGMNQCHVVIACNHIAKSRQALFNTLNSNRIRKTVPQVLQFLKNIKNNQTNRMAEEKERVNQVGIKIKEIKSGKKTTKRNKKQGKKHYGSNLVRNNI
jgi:hypothetical protein